MKRYMNKKTVAVLALMTLLLTTAIGGTLAYLIDKSNTVENKFTPSAVTTSVEETLTDDGIKKNVMIQNTGDTEAYIRAAVVVTWKKVGDDGAVSVYGTAPVEGTDYEITWSYKNGTDTLEDDTWIKGSDGFYYHKAAVAPDPDGAGEELGGMTSVLFTDCKPKADTAPDDYTLSVEIIASGIQSQPAEAVEAWSNGLFTISENGLVNKTTGIEGGN